MKRAARVSRGARPTKEVRNGALLDGLGTSHANAPCAAPGLDGCPPSTSNSNAARRSFISKPSAPPFPSSSRRTTRTTRTTRSASRSTTTRSASHRNFDRVSRCASGSTSRSTSPNTAPSTTRSTSRSASRSATRIANCSSSHIDPSTKYITTSVPSSSTFCNSPSHALEGDALGPQSTYSQGPCSHYDTVLAAPAAPTPCVANVLRLDQLPENLLHAIFGLILERDLCRVAQVCRRFRDIADNPRLWRRLYKEVFEYDHALFHPQPRKFEFQSAEGGDGDNPWKKSFRQLYHGVHVRPGYHGRVFCGRKITYFQNVISALTYSKERVADINASSHDALIFLHAGSYDEEIIIDFNVALIGAAEKEVSTFVILEGKSASTVTITEGAYKTYVGHLTLNFTVTEESDVIHEYCCLEIFNRCSPTVDCCVVQRAFQCAAAIRVSGQGAKPTIKNCHITGCGNMGLCVQNKAEGTYVDNEICHTRRTGIWVKDEANPTFRRNVVHNADECGVKVSGRARGLFEEVEVYKTHLSSFEVFDGASPVVLKSFLMSGVVSSVCIHHGASGFFTGNKMFSSYSPAIYISTRSNPTILQNQIVNSQIGVLITEDGKGLIEKNEIIGCTLSGIKIVTGNPIIRKNKICRGDHLGIFAGNQSLGLVEENEIYSNSATGLWISSGSRTCMRRNRIHSGNEGVHFDHRGLGELEDNYIFNNLNFNLIIKNGSNPLVRKNKIWGGGKGGILVSNHGMGYIINNEIHENNETGVQIEDYSTPVFESNKIFDSRGYGVRICQNGQGTLIANEIRGNLNCGVQISTHSHGTLRQNRIFSDNGVDIDVDNNSTVTLENNEIITRSNTFGTIGSASGVQPVSEQN